MNFNYSFKWVLQRVTAVLLIPLSFWFIYSCISFQHLNYFQLQIFFNSYSNSFLFILMMIAMIIHSKIGCETIVEDYVSNFNLRNYFKTFINIIAFFSLFLSIVAIIKINISI